jgi:hypothetical protein
VTTTLPRAVAVGDQPRTSALALLAALATVVVAATVRVLAPGALLGLEPSLAVAVLAGALAAGVGRYRGGVLAAILAAALPVFAVDAATTAVAEPLTPALVARAATAAAWYTTGVAVLFVGPLGYAIGALARPDRDHDWTPRRLRSHLAIASTQVTPLAAWVAIALAAVAVPTLTATPIPPSPTAAAPVPAAAGLAVATDLGRRAPRALASAIAGWVGVATALHLHAQNFVVAGQPTLDPPSLTALALVAALGSLAGIPLGLVGYVTGRTLAN